MPIKQSAKKALRQTKKRTAQNLQVKNAYKKAVKSVKKAVQAIDPSAGVQGRKDLTEKLRLAQKKLDKAAKRGIIKKNTASRKLSKLMKQAKAVK